MTRSWVDVRGGGAAALAAAAVLGRAGFPVTVSGVSGPSRLVTLSVPTQDLLADLFGPRLLEGLAPSGARVLDWEGDGSASIVEDGALTTDLATLLARMSGRLAESSRSGTPAFRIAAGGRAANGRLAATSPLATCYWDTLDVPGLSGGAERLVRSVGHGWTFLVRRPAGGWFAQASVLPEDARSAVSIVADAAGIRVAELPDPDGWIDTGPALGGAIGPAGELRAGDAAALYDPLCGDGCGHALRSGVQAGALAVRALAHPGEIEALHGWYRGRIRMSFVAHLQACAELYGRARLADRWEGHRKSLVRLAGRLGGLAGGSDAAYRLVGTELIPVGEESLRRAFEDSSAAVEGVGRATTATTVPVAVRARPRFDKEVIGGRE